MLNNIYFLFYTNEKSFHIGDQCIKQFLKICNNDSLSINLVSNRVPNVELKHKDRINYIDANVDFSMSGNHFAKTMIYALSLIKEKYIFFFCDDYFIFKEPKYDELNKVLALMDCENIDYYGLDDIGADHNIKDYRKYISNCENPFHGHIYHRETDYQHVFSVQASIWNRESLINILLKHQEISLHDFDNTLPHIRYENDSINSICNDFNSYFNYLDDNLYDYHIIAYYEIIRFGVLYVKENNIGAPDNPQYINFIKNLIETEKILEIPEFKKELFQYGNVDVLINETTDEVENLKYFSHQGKMKINVYYDLYNDNAPHVVVFDKLFKKLTQIFIDIDFIYYNSAVYRQDKNYTGFGSKFGPHFMILENDENKKYFAISYWDKVSNIVAFDNVTNWEKDKLVELFTSAGTQVDEYFYQQLDFNYTPISYTTQLVSIENQIEILYNQRNERLYPNKLSFRGLLYQFREYLSQDNRFNVIDKNQSFLDEKRYIEELNASNLNFSINGAAEICNRDIEILGLGTALFRTKLNPKFHNRLIPNYHYISVDTDDIDVNHYSGRFDFYGYWKELSDRIYDRFNQVKDDYEFINFVAKNGRKWYIDNGTVDANVNIIYNLINFNKLK